MSKPQHAAPGQSFDCYAEFYKNSAYNEFPQEHRGGGSLGGRMLSADQAPIDMIDAATPDLVVVHLLTDAKEVGLDAGDGLALKECLGGEHITITPAGVEARVMVSEPHRITTFGLNGDVIDGIFESHGIDGGLYNRLVGEMVPRSDIARTLKSLWNVSRKTAPHNSLRMDGLTLQLLAQICDSPQLSPILNDRADTRISRVIDYLEAHLAAPLAVTELAAIATMSASHFSRCFKATVGEPVWAYVQRRRCERAKELLLHSREPLAEIAYRTGFANQAHMTNSLKERYGATPGAIRRDRG